MMKGMERGSRSCNVDGNSVSERIFPETKANHGTAHFCDTVCESKLPPSCATSPPAGDGAHGDGAGSVYGKTRSSSKGIHALQNIRASSGPVIEAAAGRPSGRRLLSQPGVWGHQPPSMDRSMRPRNREPVAINSPTEKVIRPARTGGMPPWRGQSISGVPENVKKTCLTGSIALPGSYQ